MAQGKGLASVFTLAVLALMQVAAAKDYTVGDASGWNYPPVSDLSFYDNWAKKYTFAPGDNLVFTYGAGAHDVQIVSQAEYAGCLTSNGQTYTSGQDTIPLPKAGDYYFLCNIPTHCSQGMKMKVTVGAAATPPPTSPPATPPVKAPAKAPVEAPVKAPVAAPSKAPVEAPVKAPVVAPVKPPVEAPVKAPVVAPVKPPVEAPVKAPANAPVKAPANAPVKAPAKAPVKAPTSAPTPVPEVAPTPVPELAPTPASEVAPTPVVTVPAGPAASPTPTQSSGANLRLCFTVLAASLMAALGVLFF